MKSLQLTSDSQKLTRGIIKKCSLCNCQFGILTREHICKKCYRSVCEQCSNHKIRVFRPDKKEKSHRLCNTCFKEHQLILTHVQTNKLKAFEDSQYSQLWTLNIGPTKVLVKPKKTGEYNQEINKLFWGSLNYSLRQMIGLCIIQSENNLQWFLNRLSSLLDKLSEKQSIQQLQSIIYLSSFICCHCSESVTVNIIGSLSDFISSQTISKQNIYHHLQLNTKQPQLSQLEEYLQYRFRKLKQNLGVNIMPSMVSLFIINKVLQSWKMAEYQIGVAAYLFASRKIIGNKNNYDMVNVEILKNIQVSQVEQAFGYYKQSTLKNKAKIETKQEQQKSQQQINVKQSVTTQQQNKKQRKKSKNFKQSKNIDSIKVQNQKLKKKQSQYKKQIETLKAEVEYLRSLKSTNASQQRQQQDSQQQHKKIKTQNEVSVLRQTILSKNLRIDEYKNQIEQLKYDLDIAKKTLSSHNNITNNFVSIQQKNYIDQEEHQKQIEQLQKQILTVKNEKQAVNRMNGILLNKLNQLTKKIVQIEGMKMQINNNQCDQQMHVEGLQIVQKDGEKVVQHEGGDCLLF